MLVGSDKSGEMLMPSRRIIHKQPLVLSRKKQIRVGSMSSRFNSSGARAGGPVGSMVVSSGSLSGYVGRANQVTRTKSLNIPM